MSDIAYDAEYCYPNSNVLINKFDIRDNETLSKAERKLTKIRQRQLQAKPITGNFDLKHLQNIHKHLFQDIYPFAGKLRNVDIAKGNSMFCVSHHVPTYANGIFDKLKKEQYLENTEPDKLSERLAHYLGELNALHPFREGNGRTQREFINALARHNGYTIDFSKIPDGQMLNASIVSMQAADNSRLQELIDTAISPVQESQEQTKPRSKPAKSKADTDYVNDAIYRLERNQEALENGQQDNPNSRYN